MTLLILIIIQVKVGPSVKIEARSRLQVAKDLDDDFGDDLTEADQGIHTNGLHSFSI